MDFLLQLSHPRTFPDSLWLPRVLFLAVFWLETHCFSQNFSPCTFWAPVVLPKQHEEKEERKITGILPHSSDHWAFLSQFCVNREMVVWVLGAQPLRPPSWQWSIEVWEGKKKKKGFSPISFAWQAPFPDPPVRKGGFFFIFTFFTVYTWWQLQDLAHPWIKAKRYRKEEPSNLLAIPIALQILTSLLNLLASVHFSEFLASCYCVLSGGFSYNQWERL